MDTIKTKSGREFNCPYFSTIPTLGKAYIAVSGLSFVEAASLFSDAEEMSIISFGKNVIDGYTHLDWLMVESYGIKAQLSRG